MTTPDGRSGGGTWSRLRHVYGHDVVEASLRATTTPLTFGTCLNISQNETVRLDEALRRIAAMLGRRCLIASVPRAELVVRGLLPACSPWSMGLM
jgi:nucleoside-diphosphate-sugar epimerase